jgi:hypothetical protein
MQKPKSKKHCLITQPQVQAGFAGPQFELPHGLATATHWRDMNITDLLTGRLTDPTKLNVRGAIGYGQLELYSLRVM